MLKLMATDVKPRPLPIGGPVKVRSWACWANTDWSKYDFNDTATHCQPARATEALAGLCPNCYAKIALPGQ